MIDKTGMIMRPIFATAQQYQKRILFAEGEEERVLFAVKAIVEEGIGRPVLIGRPHRVQEKLNQIGLNMTIGEDFELIDQQNNPYYSQCVEHYHKKSCRHGIDPHTARLHINTRLTILGAVLIELGIADTMICGTLGRFNEHFKSLENVLGTRQQVISAATMSMLITSKGTVFVADTNVTDNPTVAELVNIAELCVLNVKKFGIVPKIAADG